MDVLKKAYHGVFSLQDYLHGTLPEPINQELTVNQRKGFHVFLSKTVVGLLTSSSLQKRIVPCLRSETDEQTQVVEEVIHELLRSGRRNDVLTLGLSRSVSCDVGLSFHPDHNYPQLITPHWSKLLQIIGKSFMKDLLLNTSIFTEVASSCYIQLSGVPVNIILSEKLNSHPKSSVKKGVTSQRTNHLNSSANLDKAISAVTLCYDKGLHRKLHKSNPLNSLPASNVGANHLTYQIFQKEKFDKGKVTKKKMKRIPQRLRRSKDLLKQLLVNFKKTRLQVFHQKATTEVDVIQQETAQTHLPLLIPPNSSAGPSTEVTMETEATMKTKENIIYPCKTEDLNNVTCSEKVTTGKVATGTRIDGKDDVCGLESSENRMKDHGKPGTCNMSGGEIFIETPFKKRKEVNIDVMEGQTVSLVEPILQKGNTFVAVKNKMIPDTPEGNSHTGDQHRLVRETECVNGSKDDKENNFEKSVTDDYSGSISSVLDGSVELFSSPEGGGGIREGLVQHEMGVIAASSIDSSAKTEKKLDTDAESEFVRKHIAMATTYQPNQSQHSQICFVKGRNLQLGFNTTPEVDNMGSKESERGNHLSPLEVTDQEERTETSNCQKEQVCIRDTSLQQDLENSGEDVLTSLSSENLLQSVELERDVSHLDREVMRVKMLKKKIINTMEEDNECYFDAQENLADVVDLKMAGTESISKTGGLDALLEQNIQPMLDRNPQTKMTAVVGDTLDSCDDVIMNEDECVNEESQTKLQYGLDKVESVNVCQTVVLQGNLSKSCDEEQIGEDMLDRNPGTLMTSVIADTLDSCDDVIMNEDEFVNEESRTKLELPQDKVGTINVGRTVVLQVNVLESCDDEQMCEENFFCEGGRSDKVGKVKIPSYKMTDSEKFMEKDALPHLNSGSYSSQSLRRANIKNMRMQLKQKLKQKKAKRKNSFISKSFHSCKNRISGEREQHQCYHGNKRHIIKALSRRHKNVTECDNRSLQSGSSDSRKDERYKKTRQDRIKKVPGLSSEPPCFTENGTVRCFPCVKASSDNVSMHINSIDMNVSHTGGDVQDLASNLHMHEHSDETNLHMHEHSDETNLHVHEHSGETNLHVHEHSGETNVGRHNRNRLCHKTYSGMTTVKWTVSKSKQRNWKGGFHSNSNLKYLHGKTQSLVKGCIKGRKSRNALSMQFGEDSPLAKGLSGGEVFISLRGLLKKIIPEELWGSTANQNGFFKYIKLLLKLGRFEKLPLSLMSKSLKFSDCDWTRGTKEDWKRIPKTDRIKRKKLMEGLFAWLVTDLVVPLIRMLYYVTETSVSKNELVYYPKDMWKKMQEKAIYDYKKSDVVTPVDEDNIKLMIISQKTLGKSKLRFIPKETGFRPIVKMGKSTLPNKQKFGINLLLRDLLDVLTHLRKVHSQLFASSLLGITSIYAKWKEFAQKRCQTRESRPLYFVKVDISKCYDSIPHDKLPEVVAVHLKQQNLAQKYLIRRYTVTSVSGLGDIRKKAMRHVTPVEGERDFGHSFHQILCDMIKDGSHHKSVITNQASFHLETVDSLLSRLRQLINYDIVSIGNLDFLRTKGISQGSVLSSLLCSIFYGNMENRYLTGVDKDGLLMRLIDDFLLVTPHLQCATKFLKVLLSGECADTFGCRVNPQKTLTNFEFIYESQPVQQLEGEWFPWCGFLFNVKTLEVKNDYQRYAATSFRYSMTLSFSADDTLKMMKLKLIQALHRSKGLVIFIDPSINSQKVIMENVYHLFLLTAFRFHSYHQALPQLLKRSNTIHDLLGIILDIAPSFYFKAKNTLQRFSGGEEFPLSLTEVKWLCIKAFSVKLSRHFGGYKRLLLVLRQQRRKLARKLDSSTRHLLSQGSTPDIPTVFNKTRI